MSRHYSRMKLAEYLVKSGKPTDKLAEEVAAFLIETDNTDDLESLMRDVSLLRIKSHGIVELKAISAYPLDADTKSQIKSLVKNNYQDVREIIIHEEIDKDLIGGVKLQFANASLDLTIRSKLNKLKQAVT